MVAGKRDDYTLQRACMYSTQGPTHGAMMTVNLTTVCTGGGDVMREILYSKANCTLVYTVRSRILQEEQHVSNLLSLSLSADIVPSLLPPPSASPISEWPSFCPRKLLIQQKVHTEGFSARSTKLNHIHEGTGCMEMFEIQLIFEIYL